MYKQDSGLGGCLFGVIGLFFILIACFALSFMVMGFFKILDPSVPVPESTFVYSIVVGFLSFILSIVCLVKAKQE